MEAKTFGDKNIIIRRLSQKDLKNAKKFQGFVNSLIEEGAQILFDKKFSLEEERKWLEEEFKNIKNSRTVFLVAEHEDKVISIANVDLNKGRQNHTGILGVSIRKEYRRIGLGTYLIAEILKLTKKELKPKPKIIRLSVFPTNKPAIKLYKKFGFKEVARIPKQIQYKGKLIDEIVMLKEL